MPLKPQTLAVAIQCLAAESRALERRLEADNPPDAAALEQLLLSYDNAAEDLKAAYAEAQARWGHLPGYDTLVGE